MWQCLLGGKPEGAALLSVPAILVPGLQCLLSDEYWPVKTYVTYLLKIIVCLKLLQQSNTPALLAARPCCPYPVMGFCITQFLALHAGSSGCCRSHILCW